MPIDVVSVIPQPSYTGTPAAKKNSRISEAIGAAPDTANLMRPPKMPRTRANISPSTRSNSACSSAVTWLAPADPQAERDGIGGGLLAARRHHRHRDRVDLLEDARHRRQHGRLHGGQLGDDLRRVAAEVGDRGADLDAVGLDQLGEHVGQRQVQVDDVALAEQLHLGGRAAPGGEARGGSARRPSDDPWCPTCR